MTEKSNSSNTRVNFQIDPEALGLLVTGIGGVSIEQKSPASQLLRLIMDNIPQAVFWKNLDSVYVWCNKNFAFDAGVGGPENIVGKTDFDLVWTREQAESYVEIDQRIMKNDRAEYQFIESQLQADGKLAWLVTNKVPLHDTNGNVVGILGTYEDITERKQAEEALQHAHDELEIRVRERTAAEREQRTLAEALRQTAALLNSTLKLDEVLNRILSEIERVVPHDSANIILIENDQANMVRFRGRTEQSSSPEPLLTPTMSIHDMSGGLKIMRQSMEPLIIKNTASSKIWVKSPGTAWVGSYLGAPILIENEVIGFINLNSAVPEFFNEIQAERLKVFADQAALAIKNARLYERAQELAALEERQRLARDLHDAVSQTLWTASMITDVLPSLWIQDQNEAHDSLKKLQKLVRGALAEMRILLLELRPAALVRTSMEDLMVQLSQAVMSRKNLDVRVHVEGDISLSSKVQVGIFRLAQESLNNIVKHAHATQVDLDLKMNNDSLVLSISDNGRGFDLGQKEAAGLGLEIMRERADSIGAELRIISEVGEGTHVYIVWPAKPQKD
jgi:PAS domain S-box-containing protein